MTLAQNDAFRAVFTYYTRSNLPVIVAEVTKTSLRPKNLSSLISCPAPWFICWLLRYINCLFFLNSFLTFSFLILSSLLLCFLTYLLLPK